MTVTMSEIVSKIILFLTYKTITNDVYMTKVWGEDMSLGAIAPACPPVATCLVSLKSGKMSHFLAVKFDGEIRREFRRLEA